MKLQTVNIVEENADSQLTVHAFHETAAGNKKAEKLFIKIALENGAHKEQLNFHLENGYYSCGTYTVFLVHSE